MLLIGMNQEDRRSEINEPSLIRRSGASQRKNGLQSSLAQRNCGAEDVGSGRRCALQDRVRCLKESIVIQSRVGSASEAIIDEAPCEALLMVTSRFTKLTGHPVHYIELVIFHHLHGCSPTERKGLMDRPDLGTLHRVIERYRRALGLGSKRAQTSDTNSVFVCLGTVSSFKQLWVFEILHLEGLEKYVLLFGFQKLEELRCKCSHYAAPVEATSSKTR